MIWNRFQKAPIEIWTLSSPNKRTMGMYHPVQTIFSTSEEDHQNPWGIPTVTVRKIISAREDRQYPRGRSSVPMRYTGSTCEEDYQYRELISSIPFTRTAYPHRYWCSPSWVLCILTGTAGTHHEYWWFSSWVLSILTSTKDSLYRVCMKADFHNWMNELLFVFYMCVHEISVRLFGLCNDFIHPRLAEF